MELKIGNTILVDDILNVNFKNSKLADQIMVISQKETYLMANGEEQCKMINEYKSYFIDDLKYNNSLINLNSTQLDVYHSREYDEDDNDDRLYSNISVEKEDDKIAILNFNGKNYMFKDELFIDQDINDDDNIMYDSFVKEAKNNIESNYFTGKKVNLFKHIIRQENNNVYYHYLTIKTSDDLLFIFCIYCELELDSYFFKNEKFCMVMDNERFEFLNVSEFYPLLDFLIDNKEYNFLYDKEEKINIENFKYKLKCIKYSLFDIISDSSKLFELSSLFNFDISTNLFKEKLVPVYKNEKLNLVIYILHNKKFNDGYYAITINGEEKSMHSIDDKNTKDICNEIINYFCRNSRMINIFTGKINEVICDLIYEDISGLIIKEKTAFGYKKVYYKKIEDCYVKVQQSYGDVDNNDFIKEIEERSKMKDILEED